MSHEQTYEIFEWINSDYLKKVLESHETASVKIIEHKVTHATAKGENYIGAMFRGVIKYSIGTESNPKNIQLIIKARQDDPAISEITEDLNIFERESQAYKCIIKESMKLLNEIQDTTVFGPRFVFRVHW